MLPAFFLIFPGGVELYSRADLSMPRYVVGHGRQCLLSHNFVGQKFRQASSGLFFSVYCLIEVTQCYVPDN